VSALDLGDTVGGITGSGSGGTTVDAGVASVTVGEGSNGGVNVDVNSDLNGGTTANVNLLGNKNAATANIQSGDLLNSNLSALGHNGVIRANAKALNDSVKAKIRVLTKEDLLKICLTVGGGPACGNGEDRDNLLGVIDARLALLEPRQLISLCLNIGASGCGIVDQGGGNGGGVPPVISAMSDSEIAVRQRQCEVVLKRPLEYEADLVGLCELLRDLNSPS
jgi:hypothetical protein